MGRQKTAGLFVGVVILFLFLVNMFTPEPGPLPVPHLSPSVIDMAYVVSLKEDSVSELKREITGHLRVGVEVVTAVNGTGALRYAREHPDEVPLYILHTMRFGRHHHMQIGNPEMLGCLLSHITVWRRFLASGHETVAVFEEDAQVDEHSLEVLRQLYGDLATSNVSGWSILMLEAGHINSAYEGKPLGKYLRTCGGGDCEWYGTRGYILTRSGARALLSQALPATVQVDSLIYLMDRWETNFTMLWTATNVAKPRSFVRLSRVFDGCVKCFMPVSPWPYALSLVALVALSGAAAVAAWEAAAGTRKTAMDRCI